MEPTWQTADGRPVTIYALLDPVSRAVRYVGKTVMQPWRRLWIHRNDAKRKGKLHIHRWLNSIGAPPLMIVLEVVPPERDWAQRERRWILGFRKRGCRLCNATDGGEGLAGHVFSAEHRAKISAALTTGRHFECEQCGEAFFRKQCDIAKGDCRFEAELNRAPLLEAAPKIIQKGLPCVD